MTQSITRLQFTVATLPILVVLGLALLLSGCGGAQDARSLTVNENAAREACETFLTAWKDGKQPADLSPMVGKDSDWDQGRKLLSFEILPEQRTDGANMFFQVRRKVKTPKGAELDQEVSYVVGTSPVVTVFRSDQ